MAAATSRREFLIQLIADLTDAYNNCVAQHSPNHPNCVSLWNAIVAAQAELDSLGGSMLANTQYLAICNSGQSSS
jgi:hypothetical protein